MTNNEFLKHIIKAIAYRFALSTLNSKENFGNFKINPETRSPNEIIRHMFDLTVKTGLMIKEGHFNSLAPDHHYFKNEVARFNKALNNLKHILDEKEIGEEMCKRLIQGPLLDITTHIGQIAMLNGLNGNKILWHNYYAADIK